MDILSSIPHTYPISYSYSQSQSENGAMNEYEAAVQELRKVSRLAHRMFVRREFRKPGPIQEYRPPVVKGRKSDCNAGVCIDCGRPRSFTSGKRCRECFSKKVHKTFRKKVRAETERVKAAEAAFNNVTRKMTMAKPKNLPATPITRSTSGLRNALFEEMEALRNGSSNAQRARSVAMMANSILQSVQVEIEYHKYVNANKGRVEGEQKVVSLGTDISLVA